MRGTPRRRVGFVERSGFSVVDTTDEFFASVGRETRRAIDALLPAAAHRRAGAARSSPARAAAHFLDGVDLDQVLAHRAAADPRDHPARRQGVALLRDPRRAWIWSAATRSASRTGWRCPSCCTSARSSSTTCRTTRTCGAAARRATRCTARPLAINAGCASYFLAQIPAATSGLSDAMLVRIYEAYFEAVRAAHAGPGARHRRVWRG